MQGRLIGPLDGIPYSLKDEGSSPVPACRLIMRIERTGGACFATTTSARCPGSLHPGAPSAS